MKPVTTAKLMDSRFSHIKRKVCTEGLVGPTYRRYAGEKCLYVRNSLIGMREISRLDLFLMRCVVEYTLIKVM